MRYRKLNHFSPSSETTLSQYSLPHDTRSPFISSLDGSNLPHQYLHYYTNGTSTPIQQDDMDCVPPSPFLSSDVDMDILTDTERAPPSYVPTPWTQWNTIPEYAPAIVPPLHHNTFVTAQPSPIWPVHEPPPASQYSFGFTAQTSFHAAIHMHWDTARNDLPSFAPATPEPPVDFSHPNFLPPPESTYHTCPLSPTNAMREVHWQEPPLRASTPHPTSMATFLDEFERSLTLVTDETPSSEDNRSDHSRHFEPAPPCAIEDELPIALEPIAIHPSRTNVSAASHGMLNPARSNNRPDDAPLLERQATEPLGEGQDQTLTCFLDFHDPPHPSSERESTEPREEGQDPPPGPFEWEVAEPPEQGEEDQPPAGFLDPADRPQRPLAIVSLPADVAPQPPVSRPAPPVVYTLARLRPPTPPPFRRPSKPAPSSNTRPTRQSPARLASDALAALDLKHPATNQDYRDLAQTSVQASKRAHLGGAKVSRRLPAQCSGAGRVTQEQDGDARPASDRRDHTKRTRFVMPAPEDEVEEDLTMGTPARPRRARAAKTTDAAMFTTAGSSSTRRTTTPGPPRSILRNARATTMPYQMTTRGTQDVGRLCSGTRLW
ncbi:hypothetical protein J3R83DRAFT_5141 [Lanmaoa asiatica]|nr:hypothetical protein J3R83DRAFT_5141 [Lanmaoa asiatica]